MDFLSGWKGRPVLITGGTGFIGQHVLRQGLEAGVCIHNLSARAQGVPQGVRQHRADLRDREHVFKILKEVKPEGVIHLAAAGVGYGSDGLAEMLRANVCGTENLLAASAAVGTVTSVALAGSGFEYAPQERPISEQDPVEPFSAYGVSKAAAGLCARFYAAQMPITLLRLFSVYGTGEKEPRLVPYIISSAKKAEQVELTNCEQVRDYLYVEEAAESFWRALSQPPSGQCLRTLNVGSGSAITLRHLVNKLVDILTEKGLRPHILFGAKPYRPDEPMTYAPNIICLKRTLGWSPSKPLSEGLSKTVESMI